MDRIIEVKVNGNYISKDNKNAGVRGEANVTNLRITFDEGWDNYAKKVTFWDALGENPVKRELGESPAERILTTDLLEDITQSTRVYIVPIPEEAMTEAGMMTFVIDGYTDGKKQRSVADKLEVKDAPIASEAGEPITPTPDQATQLQLQIDEIKGDIKTSKESAEIAVKAAKDASECSEKAQKAVGKSSYIGDNGNWFAWDSELGAFYDTGVKAQAGSTVYYGDNPPDEADVWIDPNGEPDNYYTKTEVDTRLSYKANKSDIVNAYRFCGAVPTLDDLPFAYKLIPNGVPTKNGEVCGAYNPLVEDGVVLERVCDINTTLNYGDVVTIPIAPITIKAGAYMPHTVDNFGDDLTAKIGLYYTMSGAFDIFESEQTIDHIEVYYPYSTDEPVNYPLVIEATDNFGELKKVADSWFDLLNGWRIPDGAYDNGAVYNVLDTGMNYAWNGTEWDALGGEHRDIEAHHRLDILEEQKADKSEVNTEIGKKADKLYVDESLGQLTEKINRKADEDAVYPKAETYTQTEVDNKLNNKANKSDVYTKAEVYQKTQTYTQAEINSRLSGYLTKSDIANAYRFCGSVSTFDELPFDYALIPNGAPTKNGEVCGEYVEDMGDYVHFGINTTLNYGDEVLIPIKPITLKAGTYYGNINESYLGGITIESIFGNDLSVSIGDFHNMLTAYQEIEEQTVEYIKVTFPYNTEEPANYPFYVEHINTGLGALKKLADGWLDEWYGWRIPNGAYDNGAVYNVLDTGMNYAWNGTEYDALGGEHQDLEARADIENLETQVGDIGTALDEIIEIQNTLTGGESE